MVADQATGSGRCQSGARDLTETKRGEKVPALRDRTGPGSSLVELVWSFEMCLPRGQRGTGGDLLQAIWRHRRACLELHGEEESDKGRDGWGSCETQG